MTATGTTYIVNMVKKRELFLIKNNVQALLKGSDSDVRKRPSKGRKISLRYLSQINWVLPEFNRRRFEDIQAAAACIILSTRVIADAKAGSRT